MKLYVVVPDNGYEGLAAPLGVYSSAKLARIACSGAGSYRTLLIIEHDLNAPREGKKIPVEPDADKSV